MKEKFLFLCDKCQFSYGEIKLDFILFVEKKKKKQNKTREKKEKKIHFLQLCNFCNLLLFVIHYRIITLFTIMVKESYLIVLNRRFLRSFVRGTPLCLVRKPFIGETRGTDANCRAPSEPLYGHKESDFKRTRRDKEERV